MSIKITLNMLLFWLALDDNDAKWKAMMRSRVTAHLPGKCLFTPLLEVIHRLLLARITEAGKLIVEDLKIASTNNSIYNFQYSLLLFIL